MGVLSGAYCTLAGLDVPGLAEALNFLLDMAIAVFSKCAESTSALLDALDAGQLFVSWSGMLLRRFPDPVLVCSMHSSEVVQIQSQYDYCCTTHSLGTVGSE